MKKEEKIRIMEIFIKRHTVKEIARFIVNQDEAIEGQRENMQSFREEFKKLYREKK